MGWTAEKIRKYRESLNKSSSGSISTGPWTADKVHAYNERNSGVYGQQQTANDKMNRISPSQATPSLPKQNTIPVNNKPVLPTTSNTNTISKRMDDFNRRMGIVVPDGKPKINTIMDNPNYKPRPESVIKEAGAGAKAKFFFDNIGQKVKEFAYGLGNKAFGKSIYEMSEKQLRKDLARKNGGRVPDGVSYETDMENFFKDNYDRLKKSGLSDKEIEELKKKKIAEAKNQDEASSLQGFVNKPYYWTPEKSDQVALTAGNITGEVLKMLAIDRVAGPFVGGISNPLVRNIVQRALTGVGLGGVKTVEEGGNAIDLAKNVGRETLFLEAGGLAGDVVGGVGGKILSKTPWKNSMAADIALKGLKGASFGAAGTAATLPTYSADERPSGKDIISSAVTAALFDMIPSIFNAARISNYNKQMLNAGMKDFATKSYGDYNTARSMRASNPDESVKTYQKIINDINANIGALQQNRFVGQGQTVDQAIGMLQALKERMNFEMGEVVKVSNMSGSIGEGNRGQSSDINPNMPEGLPQAGDKLTSPDQLTIPENVPDLKNLNITEPIKLETMNTSREEAAITDEQVKPEEQSNKVRLAKLGDVEIISNDGSIVTVKSADGIMLRIGIDEFESLKQQGQTQSRQQTPGQQHQEQNPAGSPLQMPEQGTSAGATPGTQQNQQVQPNQSPQNTSQVRQPAMPAEQVRQEPVKPEKPVVDKHTSTVRVNVSDINVDPGRFQYKLDTSSETGAGKLLKNVGKWDENLAGRLTLWQDNDGKLWVVNGHHRVDLANRLGVGSVDARVLKESDGVTAQDAREIGAKINIAEGRGTATDAAKLFRDGGYSINGLKDSGLSLSEGTVKKGYAIAQLNDRLFMKIVNKNITEDQGAMIGEAYPKDGGKNDSLQNTLYDYINGEGDVTKSDIEQAINMLKNSDTYENMGDQMSLIDNGNTVIFGDNFSAKKSIIKGVMRKLGSEKTLFKNLINTAKADLAEKAGNVLNSSANEKSGLIAERAIEFINRDSWKKGTAVGDIINKYANNIIAGGDAKINIQAAYNHIKQVIESGDFLKEEKEPDVIDGQVDLFGMGDGNSEKQRQAETNGAAYTGRSAVQGNKEKKAGEGETGAGKPEEKSVEKVKSQDESDIVKELSNIPEYRKPKNREALRLAEEAIQTTWNIEQGNTPVFSEKQRMGRPAGRTDTRGWVINKGVGISRQFINEGTVNLTGQVVKIPEDVAALAQVFRDPRYETFRIIYTKGNTIVGHEGRTSRIPNAAKVFFKDPATDIQEIQNHMKALGANGYYLLHNHPSGEPQASPEDEKLTVRFSVSLPGFKGHVIINHGKYSVINVSGSYGHIANSSMYDLGLTSEDKLLKPSVPNQWLGTTILDPDALAKVAKAVQTDNTQNVLIYTSAKGRVRAIQEAPRDIFNDRDKALEFLRNNKRDFGALNVFIVDSTKELKGDIYSVYTDFVSADYVTDVIYPNVADHVLAADTGKSVEKSEWMGIPIEAFKVEEAQTPYNFQTGIGIWHNKNVDQSVHVIGYLGDYNGRYYVQIQESNTGVPLDEMEFADKNRDVSQFYTNSIRNTQVLPDDVKNLMHDYMFMYDKKTNQGELEHAVNMIKNNPVETIDRIKNRETLDSPEDVAATLIITKNLRDEGDQSGDYSKLIDWLKEVRGKITNLAQSLQAVSMYKKATPDGMLMFASGNIEKARQESVKKSPGVEGKVIDITDRLQMTFDEINNDAVDKIADDVKGNIEDIVGKEAGDITKGRANGEYDPAGELAGRIERTIEDTGNEKARDMLREMVNTLFKVAKESPLPEKENMPKDKMSLIADAIQNREKYREVWNKAKEIVQKEFKEDEYALDALKAYFEKSIQRTVPDDLLKGAINKELKNMGLKVSQIIRQHYTDRNQTFKDLTDRLIKQSGLSETEALILERYVTNELRRLTQDKKREALKAIFKEKAASKGTNALKSIEELSNLGAFKHDLYKDKAIERLSPKVKKLMKESGIDIGSLVRRSLTEQSFDRVKFLDNLSRKIKLDEEDYLTVLRSVEKVFNNLMESKKSRILDSMMPKTIMKKPPKSLEDKLIEASNLGAFNSEKYRDAIGEKLLGVPALTEEDAEFITRSMEKYQAMPEGTKEEKRAKQILISSVLQSIADKIPRTKREKFRALQRISLILNPKTLITRNPLSNIILGRIEAIRENTIGPIIDMAISAARGSERTLIFSPWRKLKAEGKGFKEGIKEWREDIKYGVDTSPSRGQMELPAGRTFNNDTLNAIDNFEKRILQAGDRPFYQAAYERRLEELKIIKKTDTADEDMQVQARLYALDRVFQNNSELAKRAITIRRQLGIVGDLIIPFTQTPANVLDKLIDYTPGGLAKALYHLGSTKGGAEFDQRLFVDRLSRSMTGFGILLLGFVMAKLGLATGKPDKNKKASSFNQATGQLNYAFKMGDTYYTYDWAQPIGGLLAAGADAYNAGKDEKSFISGLGEGMVSAGDTVVKQSFLQGIFNLMSGYSPTSGFINAMAGSTTQAIPTSSKQIAQLVDPYVRDTSANGMGKEMLNKLAVRVPFVSKTLPKRVDVLGRDIRSYGGDNNIFNVLLNPGFTSKGSLTSGQKMIKSLFERTGETDILPRVAPDYFSYNGKKYTLTVEEKNEMQRYMGVETQKLYDRMSNIDSSDTAKIKSLKTSIDRIYEKAKADIVKRKVSVDAHDTLNKLNDAKLQIESSSLSKSEKALKLASINAAMIELAKKSNLMYDKNN